MGLHSSFVRRKPIGTTVTVCLILVLLVLGGCAPASSAIQSTPCTINFEATVHQGPDTGASWAGMLNLTPTANGSLSGALTQKDGGQVQVAGQANGRAINLIMDLGAG
jgi:hypothetical protein